LEGKKVALKTNGSKFTANLDLLFACVEYEAAQKGQMGSKIILYSQPFGRIATFCDRISAPGP
jgi:hypothetical protein